jgi:hypothetical protein
LANCPAFALNTRLTSAQVTAFATQAARELSALIRQKHCEDRDLLQILTVSTVPDFNLVSLPADCGEVHAVVWQRDTTDAVLLKSASSANLTDQIEDGQTWEDQDVEPTWRLEGNTIALYPTSADAEELTVYYTTNYDTSGTTVQARTGFDRWVTLETCIQVCTARDKMQGVQMFQQQKALLENDLFARARKRDVHETHTIRDVYREQTMRDVRRRGW